ncbi:hypothetical protein DPMN_087213 [Dreissena polymorpha]|uniref:Uncharacterized protein n=1 Tax=Dreissena polymorpha TaxID=45954 RepID=A0A9D4KTG2_DREPO|nr:hypothetical protein DPMN_087213 [Dreissena polymorpha]
MGASSEEVSFFNHEERPNWPMTPTKCNSCDAGPYNGHSSYQRHWAMKHNATLTSKTIPNIHYMDPKGILPYKKRKQTEPIVGMKKPPLMKSETTGTYCVTLKNIPISGCIGVGVGTGDGLVVSSKRVNLPFEKETHK